MNSSPCQDLERRRNPFVPYLYDSLELLILRLFTQVALSLSLFLSLSFSLSLSRHTRRQGSSPRSRQAGVTRPGLTAGAMGQNRTVGVEPANIEPHPIPRV
jgi:hypothetical protein